MRSMSPRVAPIRQAFDSRVREEFQLDSASFLAAHLIVEEAVNDRRIGVNAAVS